MTDPTAEYIELHAASAFSFLEAASQPENLIHAASDAAMPAIALLDRNGVYGAARFHTSAQANGIRAHIGAEIAVGDLGQCLAPPAWLPHQHIPQPVRLPLLCASRTGYQNLCQLITRFKMRQPRKCEGSALTTDLAEFSAGLICLTGGEEGPLAAALQQGGEPAGRACVEQLVQLFGHANVFVELQRHGDRAEEARNQAALRIAQSLGLPILATNGVRYATQYEREILDVFTAIRHHLSLDNAGRLLQANSQRQVRSPRAMRRLFSDLPEAIENTLHVSQRLEFELSDLGYEFPRFDTPSGEPMEVFLRKRVAEGIENRYVPKHDAALHERAKKTSRARTCTDRKTWLRRLLPHRLGHRPVSAKATTFSFRAEAAPPTPSSAMRLKSPPSIPIGMDLLFERFSMRIATNGPTWTSTCPPETSANKPSNTSTGATANSAQP